MDMAKWYKDTLERLHRRHNGSLPYNLYETIEDLVQKVSSMTAAQVNMLNDRCMDTMQTTCNFPIGIIGPTKDNMVAFYGLNHIGALPLERLESLANEANISDRYGWQKRLKASIEFYNMENAPKPS